MPSRIEVKAPIQLLVEGRDAQYFFMALLNHLNYNNVEVQSGVEWRGHARVYRESPDLISGLDLESEVDVNDLQAFHRVRNAILSRLEPGKLEVKDFGGIRDLRNFLSAVWNAPSARTTIKAIGIVRDAERVAATAFESAQDAVVSIGLNSPDSPQQVVGTKPRIGILILPPGKSDGMLEDVCLDAVHDDPAMQCVEEYSTCVQESVEYWPNRNPSKARVQAFLASRERPGLLLGQAAERGEWNWEHPTYSPIKSFIRDLAKG